MCVSYIYILRKFVVYCRICIFRVKLFVYSYISYIYVNSLVDIYSFHLTLREPFIMTGKAMKVDESGILVRRARVFHVPKFPRVSPHIDLFVGAIVYNEHGGGGNCSH